MKIRDLRKNSVACLLFTILMVLLVIFESGFPRIDDLKKATGKLEWIQATGKNGNTLQFKFERQDRLYVYHSIGGSIDLIRRALTEDNAELTVLYDPNDTDSALWESVGYHPIYELTSNGKLTKSYRAIAKKYSGNDELAFWLMVGSIIATLYFVVMDWNVARDAI